MKPFEWVNAASERQAVELLAAGKGQAVVKAGGVDLLDRMKIGAEAPARLVNIATLPSLRLLKIDGSWLRIGPTTSLSQVCAEPALRPRFAALAEAAGSAASHQIRNVATVAGNLLQRPRCAYFRNPEFECFKKGGATCYAKDGDSRYHAILGGGPSYIVHPSTLATALLALDGRLRVVGPEPEAAGKADKADKPPRGVEVPLAGFFTLPKDDYAVENRLGPGQLVTEILVPLPSERARSAYRVVKERQGFDWPLAEAAAVLTMKGEVVEEARVVLGACAPIPWRSAEAEAELTGKRLTPEVAAAAGRAAMASARPLAHNGYKVPMFTALVERTLLAAAAAGRP